MKVYVVTTRYGTEMGSPLVFDNYKDAEVWAEEYVIDAVRESYYCDCDEEDIADDFGGRTEREFLEDWASEKGYDFFGWYFWDGGDEAVEADVTETEIILKASDH